MRKHTLLLTLTFGLGLAAVLAVQAVPAGDQKKIAQLITQLGSANFRERDHATKELDAMGEAALDALRKASKNSDMEIADRATQLVARIEHRAANACLLAPTYVELSFKDTPVEQAVAELAKKSGYTIVIGGNRNQLADRKVTFETGKVPFWKAFEMLCEKAELVESDAVPPPVNGQYNSVPAPAPIAPIQLKIVDKVQPVQPKIEKPVEEKKAVEKPKAPNGFSADAPAKDKNEEAPKQPQAQAQPAMPPVQAQQQLQVQILQAQVQAKAMRRPFMPPAANATITLVDGKPKSVPTHVEGAIRVRAIDNPTLLGNFGPIPQGEFGLLFEVKPEPKIQLQQILGVKIDRAVDNYDQILDQALVAVNNPQDDVQQRVAQLRQAQLQLQLAQPALARVPWNPGQNGQMVIAARLKKGEKETKSLKEVRGEVSLRIRTPVEALVMVENIMKAKGESSKGKGDATLKILDVKKEDNGDIKIQVELQYSHEIQPRNNAFGLGQMQNNVIINNGINGNVKIQVAGPQGVPPQGAAPVNYLGLEMVDGKGGSVPMVQILDNSAQFRPAGRSYTATLLFRPKKDQEASKFAFMGTRLAVVDVPFVLKDVPVK